MHNIISECNEITAWGQQRNRTMPLLLASRGWAAPGPICCHCRFCHLVLSLFNLFCLSQEDCVCAQMREQARTQVLDRLNADVVDVADVWSRWRLLWHVGRCSGTCPEFCVEFGVGALMNSLGRHSLSTLWQMQLRHYCVIHWNLCAPAVVESFSQFCHGLNSSLLPTLHVCMNDHEWSWTSNMFNMTSGRNSLDHVDSQCQASVLGGEFLVFGACFSDSEMRWW